MRDLDHEASSAGRAIQRELRAPTKMIDWTEINQIEAVYALPSGQPALGRAFDLLIDHWKRGYRDRELALRLLFLAWYSCSEPKAKELGQDFPH